MSQRVKFTFSEYTKDLVAEEKTEYSEKLQEHGFNNERLWGIGENYYVFDNAKISKLLPNITDLIILDYCTTPRVDMMEIGRKT